MKINPSFINFTRQPNTPQAGVTTFILTGQYAAEQDTKTQLRLIDAIELDGRQVGSGVLFDLDAATSELVLRFDYFNSTLVYDPGTRTPKPVLRMLRIPGTKADQVGLGCDCVQTWACCSARRPGARAAAAATACP
jgi:hypothetical protein